MKPLTVLAVAVAMALTLSSQSGMVRVPLRTRPQDLRLYGDPGRPSIILSSGDGGWIHLGPHAAELLAANGYYVVGFDVRAYLHSFTGGASQLQPADVPADFAALVSFATRQNSNKPILIGVSEGAGLSVLAGASAALQPRIAGVVGLGLGNLNELAWRWRDSIIYVTKGVPNEPTFAAAEFIGRIAPLPTALLRSSHDEFVPAGEADRLAALARQPKRVWTIRAADHRFSDNLPELDARLLEAVAWITAQRRPLP